MAPKRKLLSTGQAARLCSVTPDTVLKWIKAGKVPARRTPGGHFRVDPRDLPMLVNGRVAGEGQPPTTTAARRQFQYCWEYNSDQGKVVDGCHDCLVYRTRASRCYEVVRLAANAGHAQLFCDGTCDTCDYYQHVHAQRTNVLVVSDNEILTTLLNREAPEAPFNLRTSDCEYTCAALVDSYRPDYVVLDCSMGAERTRDMCKHLREDPRLPFVRIVLAAEADEFPQECDREVFARLGKPFDIKAIAACLEGTRDDAVVVLDRGTRDQS